MTAPQKANGLLLTVHGMPGPQGSKNRGANGALYESSGRVKPWREAVKQVALDVLHHDDAWAPLNEAVALDVTFTLPRPQSHFGTGRNAGALKPSAPAYPTGTPDLDKLLRSTQDALKDAGVLADDSRVVDVHARKRYPHTCADALAHPGAVIRVRRLNMPKEPEQ
ncbi:RusA family crossover junction endodeoxyribonuclease [Streptomyces sp. NPDC090306]|uniref:RusA family crossover junction endodeoxyribonuclease n=1 Tax=Streptomyces sp. NPDC090306 TaxID=3365961 RepID=UPI003815F155